MALGTPAPFAVLAGTDEVLAADLPPTGLSEAEQRRASRFRCAGARRDYLAAHRLVRHCAARCLGVPAASVVLEQSCSECGTRDHGKPSVRGAPDLHVSLAHTRGTVAVAVAGSPVGVDVETLSGLLAPAPDDTVLGLALTPAEAAAVRACADPRSAFLRQWTRKESLVKVGRTTLGELRGTDLSALPAEPHPGPRTVPFEDWYITDWADPARRAVASAVCSSPVNVAESGEFLGTARQGWTH